jgi:hypothetical protein
VYLRGAVLLGAGAVTITEALGAAHSITRPALAAAWTIALCVAAASSQWSVASGRQKRGAGVGKTRGSGDRGQASGKQIRTGNSGQKEVACVRWSVASRTTLASSVNALIMASIIAILGIVGFIAIVSPPNSSDAMAYHLPRVVYWAEQHSVRFFPTPYLNQIMLQPFAEYFMLDGYVLTGGDHLVNLGQWFGCLTSIVAVSLLAMQFGAGLRGQILAALFCATLPNGILQASGAKNEYLMAAWLASALWFLARSDSAGDAALAGLALGLAIGTKATAYLYAPPVLVAALLAGWFGGDRLLTRAASHHNRSLWSRLVGAKTGMIVLLCALALNLPQYARNVDLSGSPLGFAGAFGDGRFQWRNETFGWRQTASNFIRNSTEQVGARSERWNQWLYDRAVALERVIGANPNDPATTWPGEKYEPPRNANHEVNASNRWHLLIVAACVFWLGIAWMMGKRDGRMLLYSAALVAGFVLFCFYLKWQPFMARMFLPLFVLASPLAGVVLEGMKPAVLQIALCVFLLNNARPYLQENWVRPLKGPRSVLRTTRDENYFADMTQWEERKDFAPAVDAAARLRCSVIGIDINRYQLEYPFMALLRERNPAVQFVHTGVSNVSMRYAPPVADAPCAVLCLDCAGDPASVRFYGDFGPPRQIGHFLLFSSSQIQ